jgi:hypothetical protein
VKAIRVRDGSIRQLAAASAGAGGQAKAAKITIALTNRAPLKKPPQVVMASSP